MRGRWVYLYRAVDREGNTVDFRLSPTRDVAAAKALFRKALRTQRRVPVSITLDGYAASHRAVREMPREDEAWKHTKLRSSKYLNNLIEQDHRGIKSRTGPMLGFKNFDCAATTIAMPLAQALEGFHRATGGNEVKMDKAAFKELRGKIEKFLEEQNVDDETAKKVNAAVANGSVPDSV